MELTLAMPPQRTTAPILVLSIILGLLLSPLLEGALESWMPVTTTGAQQQSNRDNNRSTWDLWAMWN
jgi:hypothetical protein